MTETMLDKMAEAIGRQMAEDDNDNIDLARAALQAIRQADMETGLVGAAEVSKQMRVRGKVMADYCAAQDSFTAMIDAILEGKA